MIAHRSKKLTTMFAVTTGCLLALALVALGLTIGLLWQDRQYESRIYPHVYMDNAPLKALTKPAAMKPYDGANEKLSKLQIEMMYKQNHVATISATTLNMKIDAKTPIDQAYLVGRSPTFHSRVWQKLLILLGLKRYDFYTKFEYDIKPLRETLAQVKSQYEYAPIDAKFEMKDGKVTAFQEHKNGLRLHTDDLVRQFQKADVTDFFLTGTYTMNITDEVVQPETTLENANTYGITELIGEGTSNYTHSIPGRIHNVQLATKRLNGILVPKGGTFSFVQEIGDISAASGYAPAYVIIGNRTELGDGGGVCQTSTTMFRAAINSGLPITEWHPHAYRVGYYENDSKPGRDATIFSPSVDLKFTNNTPAAILIQTEVDEENMTLHYRFYGKKDNRKVEMTEPVVYDIVGEPAAREQEDPTLPKGTRKQVDWGAAGAKAKFHYKVTTADGQVMEDRDFLSVYRPWQAVYLVGTQ